MQTLPLRFFQMKCCLPWKRSTMRCLVGVCEEASSGETHGFFSLMQLLYEGILLNRCPPVTLLGTWPTFSFSFPSVMYLYDHMTLIHMTAYLSNRAILSGTPLFPPFVRFLLFSSYGSLWPPLFVTPLFCDVYCLWLYCSLHLYA